MTWFRALTLSVTVSTVIVFGISLDAQTVPPASQSNAIAVSAALQKTELPVGQPAWVILTVKNLTNREIPVRTDMLNYRIYVEGGKGEAPKTSYHRRLRGEFQPGETELAGGGVVLSIAPGESTIRKYDLAKFYDLSIPGKYSVYIEVRDESGVWLRTNTVQFEMIPPTQ
jgi:hypothetical protein